MKWRNKPVEYEGERYRSKFERYVAQQLSQAGVPFEHEEHRLIYDKPHEYIPDFKVGSIFIEAKGYLDKRSRQTLIAVRECNPDLDIRIVFQNAQGKISHARKAMTYAQWARRHNFHWADKEIPSSWIKESGVLDDDPDALEGAMKTREAPMDRGGRKKRS